MFNSLCIFKCILFRNAYLCFHFSNFQFLRTFSLLCLLQIVLNARFFYFAHLVSNPFMFFNFMPIIFYFYPNISPIVFQFFLLPIFYQFLSIFFTNVCPFRVSVSPKFRVNFLCTYFLLFL